MSTLDVLDLAEFELEESVIGSRGMEKEHSLWPSIDPRCLALIEAITDDLRSEGFRVRPPEREGRGAWFKCELTKHDVGISVSAINSDYRRTKIGIVAVKIPKLGAKGIQGGVDAGWTAVAALIATSVRGRYSVSLGPNWGNAKATATDK